MTLVLLALLVVLARVVTLVILVTLGLLVTRREKCRGLSAKGRASEAREVSRGPGASLSSVDAFPG